MTTTQEERARAAEIWAAADLADTKSEAEALIAQAIREAEDAAIERAIACVSDNFVNGEGHYAIEAIRALKHNKG